MRSRMVMLGLALLLGLGAAIGVASYLSGVRAQVQKEVDPVETLVAQENIPAGTSIKDLAAKGRLGRVAIPKKYVAEGAINSLETLDESVTAVSVSRGEQLTPAKFEPVNEAGLSYAIPKGMVALTIPLDEVRGVGTMMQPGDEVSILVTFSPGPEGEDSTRTLLQKVPVLAVGKVMEKASKPKPNGVLAGARQIGPAAQPAEEPKRIITLAVTPSNAEKVVFAQEQGKVWLSLMPAPDNQAVATAGRNLKTVFK